MSSIHAAHFSIGQIVQHRLYGYRGVIADVDPCFQGSDEWYEKVALMRPDRQQPWYHILIDGSIHRTYAPENNLELDASGEPVTHPEMSIYFSQFSNGVYTPIQSRN